MFSLGHGSVFGVGRANNANNVGNVNNVYGVASSNYQTINEGTSLL